MNHTTQLGSETWLSLEATETCDINVSLATTQRARDKPACMIFAAANMRASHIPWRCHTHLKAKSWWLWDIQNICGLLRTLR